jgi:hypothetical protein
MELLLTLVVAAHWMACVWFFTGYPDGWVSREFEKTEEMLEGPAYLWVQWISSFYFAITTMSTIGYGDITANSSTERVVAVCCMVTGCVFFAMLTGMKWPCTLALKTCALFPTNHSQIGIKMYSFLGAFAPISRDAWTRAMSKYLCKTATPPIPDATRPTDCSSQG